MKRIDSIRRSPIYTNFDETLVGVACIRAFRQQERFVGKNDQLVDESQMAWYPILIAQRSVPVHFFWKKAVLGTNVQRNVQSHTP